MAIGNYNHNDGAYALMLSRGNYKAALREAIRAIRREPNSIYRPLWELRVWGCFKRRHEN